VLDSELPGRSTLTAGELLEDRGLSIDLRLAGGGAGLARRITHTRIQKSGLALAGHFHGVVPSRIQILGETELSYFNALGCRAAESAASGFFGLELHASSSREVPSLRRAGSGGRTTQVRRSSSPERSSRTITAIHALLDDRLRAAHDAAAACSSTVRRGASLSRARAWIGKSECAALISSCAATGSSPTTWSNAITDRPVWCSARPRICLRHHIEVRGLGVLNIKDLFGVTSVRERKRIDIVVKLVEWSADAQFDRMGVDDHFHKILGVSIRELVIPVRPGRNMGSILEIAARNQLLRDAGHHGAREFFQRIEGALLPSPVTEPESMSPPAVRPTGREGSRK
jgi:HPr kinase/phosphorylase